ncbi:MAG TPA: septal ring lytic transglycosylase RlpA family protein [Solirubrobacteraceae bacterium]
MRDRRAIKAAVAAMLAFPVLAILTPGRSLAQGSATTASSQGAVPFQLHSSQIDFRDRVAVSGITPASPAAPSLELQFAPAGSSVWRTLVTQTATAGARFQLSARLTTSGSVRVVESAPGVVFAARIGTASSTIHRVVVAATLHVRQRKIGMLAGTPVSFRGRLLPGLRGRVVQLQARAGRTWYTIASARTKARGAFTISYLPQTLGPQWLRVRFSGDRLNARFASRAGTLTVFRQAGASWYYDRGATACGFNAFYGVANRTLPCGTKVQLRLGSRTVTAVVDDRGPYVAGREWDLGQNTAAALGFVGVETIWSSL